MFTEKEEFDGYSIAVTTEGLEGQVYYQEQGRRLDFYWVYLREGGVSVSVPPPGRVWEATCESHKMPWARGRREEILGRVGEFFIRSYGKGLFVRVKSLLGGKPEYFYEIEDYTLMVRRN